MALLLLSHALLVTSTQKLYHVYDAAETAHGAATPIAVECMGAAQAAKMYGVHVRDTDGNNLITIDDIGPAAVRFGMHWLDDAPRDGLLSLAEVRSKWTLMMSWYIKTASWATSFVTWDYSPESIFHDCAAPSTPHIIAMADYLARRHTTCMETCAKAERVLKTVGGHFGRIE